MSQLHKDVLTLLEKNRRYVEHQQYTIPASDTYPFQWHWDSCFHALILARCGETAAAKEELRSILSCPLPKGLLPHIIYWNNVEKFPYWGRETRGAAIVQKMVSSDSSSITQPPLVAATTLRLHTVDPDQSFLEQIYPVIAAHHHYLLTERRFTSSALVYIINPDESGEDNSPRFDAALKLPPKHSAAEHLNKRIELMDKNAQCNFEGNTCMRNYFAVADTPFNVLMVTDLQALSTMATLLGYTEDAAYFTTEADRIAHAIKTRLCRESIFGAYDANGGTFAYTKTWAMFMPLYAGLLSDKEAKALVHTYLHNDTYFHTHFSVPTVARSEAAYDPENGFWRGPVWMAPNWFVYHGLKRYGFTAEAEKVKNDSTDLVTTSGFREHYHPDTGAGLGANEFTWGGLVLDME